MNVKIITGYSERGGSTVALINLTNAFNKHGVKCTLYGPHDWHLDKCESDSIKNVKLNNNDRIITHFLNLEKRPEVKKVILTIHEKGWFPVGKIKRYWDTAIFLHDKHREFHSDYIGEYSTIPNLKDNLIPNQKSESVKDVCGIIGTIENRKQTHKSIERAIAHGCKKINIYGKIGEEEYFNKNVKQFLNDDIKILGFSENKQEMYNSISKVFHSSLAEVACLVKDECYQTDTEFFGNEETEHEVSKLTNEEIMDLWIKELLN